MSYIVLFVNVSVISKCQHTDIVLRNQMGYLVDILYQVSTYRYSQFEIVLCGRKSKFLDAGLIYTKSYKMIIL